MKIIDIALKDLTRSMRSAFAVLFMFGVPLLVTGMFYFMFGNIASDGGGGDLPVIRVVVVDLDEGSPSLQLASSMIGLTSGQSFNSLGEMIVQTLKSEAFGSFLTLTVSEDAAIARDAVDQKLADATLIIPEDFSRRFT
jgi:hypothetical protein